MFMRMYVAFTLLLLFLARRHKQNTQKERARLHQSRKKTQRVVDKTKMVPGINHENVYVYFSTSYTLCLRKKRGVEFLQ